MKTFAEFQESVTALALKGGSKLLPKLMVGIGAAGTILQSRRAKKARKPYEKRTGFKSKETSSKESKEDMLKRVREAQARVQSQVDTKQKMKKANQPYIEPKKGEIIQDEFSAPTNNVGGGKIAGTVEAGDDPPVKKKKKFNGKTYAYGGRGSRKMWMS
mgnify:CR=1 FL=1